MDEDERIRVSNERAYAVAQAFNGRLAVPLTPEQSRGIVVQVDRSAREGGPGWPEFDQWLNAFEPFAARPDRPDPHPGHNLTFLERDRRLTDGEVACYLADHQTALRHGTADVGTEIAEMLRDRLGSPERHDLVYTTDHGRPLVAHVAGAFAGRFDQCPLCLDPAGCRFNATSPRECARRRAQAVVEALATPSLVELDYPDRLAVVPCPAHP